MPQPQVLASSPTAGVHAAPMPFECSWTAGGSQAAWVHVTGEVDLLSAPQLQQTLREAQANAPLVVLDLRAASFLDSTGIHAIVTAADDARNAGGRLTLVRGPAQVDRVLTLTGVDRLIPIIDLDRNA